MSEQEPEITIRYNDQEYVANPRNTKLFTFAGELASRDVVSLDLEGQSDDIPGLFIFNDLEVYEEIIGHMVRNDYPLLLNLREVPPAIETAFQTHLDQTVDENPIDDFIPDWMQDGNA